MAETKEKKVGKLMVIQRKETPKKKDEWFVNLFDRLSGYSHERLNYYLKIFKLLE